MAGSRLDSRRDGIQLEPVLRASAHHMAVSDGARPGTCLPRGRDDRHVATHVAPPRNPSSSSTRLFPVKNSVALPARECVPCRKEERCAAPLLSSLGSFRHVFSQVCPLCLARFDAVLEGKRCLGFVWLTCTALQCFFF